MITRKKKMMAAAAATDSSTSMRKEVAVAVVNINEVIQETSHTINHDIITSGKTVLITAMAATFKGIKVT